MELAGPALTPALDPLSHLVYSASREQVTDVWIAGEHLLAGGELTRLDVEAIVGRAEKWGTKIQG